MTRDESDNLVEELCIQIKGSEVIGERVGLIEVERWDLDVRHHVTRDEDLSVCDPERSMSRGMGSVLDDLTVRGPERFSIGPGREEAAQVYIMTRALLGDVLVELCQFGLAGIHVGPNSETRDLGPEPLGPEDMVPMGVCRPSKRDPKASLLNEVRDHVEIGWGNRRVNEHAAGVIERNDGARRHLAVTRVDPDTVAYGLDGNVRRH